MPSQGKKVVIVLNKVDLLKGLVVEQPAELFQWHFLGVPVMLVEAFGHLGTQMSQPLRREGAVVEQGGIAGRQFAQLRQEVIL